MIHSESIAIYNVLSRAAGQGRVIQRVGSPPRKAGPIALPV